MKAERVVCDTNVLISAAIKPDGKAQMAADFVIDNGRLVLSQKLFCELTTRLTRPRFDRYLTGAARQNFLGYLLLARDFVSIPGTMPVCRDRDDDKVIETAIVGKSDTRVTGDGDLFALRPADEAGTVTKSEDVLFRTVAIVRPAEFLQLATSG